MAGTTATVGHGGGEAVPGALTPVGFASFRMWPQGMARALPSKGAKANTRHCGLARGLWAPENRAFVRN